MWAVILIHGLILTCLPEREGEGEGEGEGGREIYQYW
jgi:hypothetical protein